MKNLIGVLLFIWAGSFLIGCGETDAAAALEVRELNLGATIQGCEGTTQEGAVMVVAHDADFNDTMLTGLNVRHRINGGPWQPEVVSTAAPHPIPGTAGTYEIEVRKDSYKTQYGTIIVPQEESCTILPQTWDLVLEKQNSCPQTPTVLIMNMNIIPPSDSGMDLMLNMANGNAGNGLAIKLNTPNDTQEIICQDRGACSLNLELSSLGDYVIQFTGFLDHRRMMVLNDFVSYDYTALKIDINGGMGGKRTILSEGVSSVTVTVPYRYGDSGCMEALLDSVIVATDHAQTATENMVETRERFAFNVENYPSNRCPASSNSQMMTPMVYDVLLPAGTRASTVRVEYWMNGGWQQANCNYGEGFQCTAMYPNPLVADKYQVRTMINDQEHNGTYISLGNKCIVFGNQTFEVSTIGSD